MPAKLATQLPSSSASMAEPLRVAHQRITRCIEGLGDIDTLDMTASSLAIRPELVRIAIFYHENYPHHSKSYAQRNRNILEHTVCRGGALLLALLLVRAL
jgi:hypothetical protein